MYNNTLLHISYNIYIQTGTIIFVSIIRRLTTTAAVCLLLFVLLFVQSNTQLSVPGLVCTCLVQVHGNDVPSALHRYDISRSTDRSCSAGTVTAVYSVLFARSTVVCRYLIVVLGCLGSFAHRVWIIVLSIQIKSIISRDFRLAPRDVSPLGRAPQVSPPQVRLCCCYCCLCSPSHTHRPGTYSADVCTDHTIFMYFSILVYNMDVSYHRPAAVYEDTHTSCTLSSRWSGTLPSASQRPLPLLLVVQPSQGKCGVGTSSRSCSAEGSRTTPIPGVGLSLS